MWAALPHDRGKGGCHQPPGLLGMSVALAQGVTVAVVHGDSAPWGSATPWAHCGRVAHPPVSHSQCVRWEDAGSCLAPTKAPGTGGGMGACDQHQLLPMALPWIGYWATGCRMGPYVCVAALAPLCHPWCLCALFRAWPTACYALLGGCAERDLASWAVLGQGLNWPRSWQGCRRRLLSSCTRSSVH